MSKQFRVYIGIGHGQDPITGKGDPGAVGVNGLKESELNLQLGLSTRAELQRHNVIVGMSRTKNEIDPISEEVRECNAFNPDIAVDIHFNSASGTNGKGCEFIVYSKGGQSLDLGITLEKRMVENGQNSRGCKSRLSSGGQEYFAWIREVKAPSLIFETAFINNPDDIKNFDEPHELEKWGKILAWGILDYLKIPIKSNGPDVIISNDTTNNLPPVISTEYKTVQYRDTIIYCDDVNIGGIIIDGRSYAPVRALCEMLGREVDFKDKQVYITKKD